MIVSTTGALFILNFLTESSLVVATPLTIGTCQNDQDCLSFTLRLHQLPTGSNQVSDSGYACLNNTCSYVVSPGSVCRKASDCSQFAYLSSALRLNRSDLLPTGYTASNIGPYMDSLCSSTYCTIASSCESNYSPFYAVGLTSTDACCGGITYNEPCVQTGSLVSTCADEMTCAPSTDITSGAMSCSTVGAKASTQWIGIILTLIAAALTNLGLNLQKFALRKRHEKVVKKKENEKIGLFYRLTNLKVTVSNFYSSVSNPSLPRFPSLKPDYVPPPSDSVAETVSEPPAPSKSDNEVVVQNEIVPGHVTPSSTHTITQPSRSLGQFKSINPSDKDQFQSKLEMANLAKNPRWWLGFIVFVIGNFTNFAALNFAAQSLIGPLGSFSLVCNVIIAPIMNGEKWTWKDIVGVILIVAGAAVVVVFSGSSQPDYNVCVLLKLFQKAATVVFLIFTCGMIFLIFCYIIVVEKNLDFKEASVVVIEEAMKDGELVDVQANPHHNGSSNALSSSGGERIEIKPRAAGANNRVKRMSMVVSDEVAQDGSNLRIVTINSQDELGGERTNPATIPRDDSDDDSDDATQDVVGPSTRLSPPTARKLSITNIGQLLDADGNTIQALFNRKTGDGAASIHSVALTFKLPPSPKIMPAPVDLESNSSVSDSRLKFRKANGETVVVLPKTKKENTKSEWLTRLIEYGRQYPMIEKLYQVKLIPRFQNKISLQSRLVQYGLPFAYASLGGLMATLLTLFAKATIHLITQSFEGDNQFNSFAAYLFTFVTIFCAVSQIYWINLGLARYDALLQIPVFYVVWTLFDVIGGGVYYGEFDGFTASKYGLFSLGVGIIFLGVGILATRLASLADEDKELVKNTCAYSMSSSSLCIQRLTSERKSWRKDHPYGFYARPTKAGSGELDLKVWDIGIPGKESTAWEGGVYKVRMVFPDEYPQKPPSCSFMPPIYHPNVFDDGEICLSIINEEKGWKPSITIKQIVLGIQLLLSEPNNDDPAQKTAMIHYRDNRAEYNRRVVQQAQRFRPAD